MSAGEAFQLPAILVHVHHSYGDTLLVTCEADTTVAELRDRVATLLNLAEPAAYGIKDRVCLIAPWKEDDVADLMDDPDPYPGVAVRVFLRRTPPLLVLPPSDHADTLRRCFHLFNSRLTPGAPCESMFNKAAKHELRVLAGIALDRPLLDAQLKIIKANCDAHGLVIQDYELQSIRALHTAHKDLTSIEAMRRFVTMCHASRFWTAHTAPIFAIRDQYRKKLASDCRLILSGFEFRLEHENGDLISGHSLSRLMRWAANKGDVVAFDVRTDDDHEMMHMHTTETNTRLVNRWLSETIEEYMSFGVQRGRTVEWLKLERTQCFLDDQAPPHMLPPCLTGLNPMGDVFWEGPREESDPALLALRDVLTLLASFRTRMLSVGSPDSQHGVGSIENRQNYRTAVGRMLHHVMIDDPAFFSVTAATDSALALAAAAELYGQEHHDGHPYRESMNEILLGFARVSKALAFGLVDLQSRERLYLRCLKKLDFPTSWMDLRRALEERCEQTLAGLRAAWCTLPVGAPAKPRILTMCHRLRLVVARALVVGGYLSDSGLQKERFMEYSREVRVVVAHLLESEDYEEGVPPEIRVKTVAAALELDWAIDLFEAGDVQETRLRLAPGRFDANDSSYSDED